LITPSYAALTYFSTKEFEALFQAMLESVKFLFGDIIGARFAGVTDS
jgi:hypothetical protein